jgi:hypothetical protein
MSRIGGVSPLSLVTFFAAAAAAKKVTAAPHRGNARAAQAQKRMPAKGKAYLVNSPLSQNNLMSVIK